jgi:hypothetical protein
MVTQVKHVIHIRPSYFVPEIWIKFVNWPVDDWFKGIFSCLESKHLKFTQLFFTCMTNQGAQLLY